MHVGIFVGGPANLISSAISADLGKEVRVYAIWNMYH